MKVGCGHDVQDHLVWAEPIKLSPDTRHVAIGSRSTRAAVVRLFGAHIPHTSSLYFSHCMLCWSKMLTWIRWTGYPRSCVCHPCNPEGAEALTAEEAAGKEGGRWPRIGVCCYAVLCLSPALALHDTILQAMCMFVPCNPCDPLHATCVRDLITRSTDKNARSDVVIQLLIRRWCDAIIH